MNRFWSLAAAVGLAICSGVGAGAVEVVFGDPVVEAKVRVIIDKPDGPIDDSELVGVGFTELTIEQFGVRSLAGLEFATDLEVLSLPDNLIADLTPIAGLTGLRDINLAGNAIADLEALELLVNLQSLEIGSNAIDDIGSLGELSNLMTLGLSDNMIEDITALAGLILLTDVDLSANQITDATPLLDNPGLGFGDTIDLTGNPLAVDTVCQVVPDLESRRVDVLFEGECPGRIEGLVTDASTGRLLDCAIVIAEGPLLTPGLGPTDFNGEYAMDDLAPGDYNLSVFAPGYERAFRTGRVRVNQTDTANFALDPVLRDDVEFFIGAVVENVTGLAVVGAEIQVTAGAALVDTAFSCGSGEFELLIPAGRTGDGTLTVSAPGYFSEEVDFTFDGEQEFPVVLSRRMNFTGSIGGTVLDGVRGDALEDARIVAKPVGGFVAVSTNSDDDGMFLLDNLASGEYAVTFSSSTVSRRTATRRVTVDGDDVTVAVSLQPTVEPMGPGCAPGRGREPMRAGGDLLLMLAAGLALACVQRLQSRAL